MLDLIIVSGASRGIGASIVARCAPLCRTMIVIGSSSDIFNVKSTSSNCQIIPIQRNISDYNQIYLDVLDLTSQNYEIKKIGIVLAAAQLGEPGGLFNTNLESWDKTYKCNVLGNLAIVKACEELLKQGANCKIVFFGGGGAATGYSDFSAYALSKCAMVRAVENLADECKKLNYDSSSIIIAPGAIDTDMLAVVIANGGTIKTRTHIDEPTTFVEKFLTGKFDTEAINGRFLHVRDKLDEIDFTNQDMCKLRRIQ